MRFPAALLLSGTLVVPVLSAQKTTVSGYVTRAASRSDFDVNRIRIECNKNTNSGIIIGDKMLGRPGCPRTDMYVGEPARVEGSFDKAQASITADTIGFIQTPGDELSGSAVIDRVPPSASSPAAAGELVVRADGYLIHIPGKALIVWGAPLHSFADVKVGDWIDYEGHQQPDGTVVAEKVRFAPVVVGKREEQYRSKSNFNPSKVPASAKQSGASMYFLGMNPKRFPPYKDPEMQARIDEIGDKLIPAWQRDLIDSDPAKVHFRFQVISTRKFRDALALSSGVILVPQQVVARMQNDSQLAAVLADNIAVVLERWDFRHLSDARELAAAGYGADAAGFFIPGVVLVDPLLGVGGYRALMTKQEHQSGRVALALMRDAGYDIDQAPVAWWLLASKTPKPISDIPLPGRAAYLYKILGECWNNPAAVAGQR